MNKTILEGKEDALYRDTFGMFRDDSTFADFVKEVQQYRRKRNQITSSLGQR